MASLNCRNCHSMFTVILNASCNSSHKELQLPNVCCILIIFELQMANVCDTAAAVASVYVNL